MCTSINMMTKTTTIAMNALTMLIACFLIFPGAIILAAGYHENTSTVPLSHDKKKRVFHQVSISKKMALIFKKRKIK